MNNNFGKFGFTFGFFFTPTPIAGEAFGFETNKLLVTDDLKNSFDFELVWGFRRPSLSA